jgi:hypothetical protein
MRRTLEIAAVFACALLARVSYGQTVSQVFTCPTSTVSEGTRWSSACPAATYQAVNSSSRVLAGPTSGPSWRTYSLLTGADVVRVCAPANLSADRRTCTSSQWVAKSTLTTTPGGAGNVGTALLSWTHPTENTDEKPLTDLRGFRVWKSTTPGELVKDAEHPTFAPIAEVEPNLVDGMQRFGPIDLAAGTHYFAITAFACDTAPCADGVPAPNTRRESTLSVVANKVITAPLPVTVSLSCAPNERMESVTPQCSWGSANATSCSASNAWTGSRPLSGTETLPKITTTATYTLTCTGPGGSASISTTVRVSQRPGAPPIVTVQ